MGTEELREHFYTYGPEDEIDLRELVATLLRNWKVIAGAVVLVAAAVGALNEFVIPPTYESSAVVMFRNDNTALDIDFRAFQALASSPAVMSTVIQQTGVDWSIQEISDRFQFKAETNAPMMTVRARAQDPHLAAELVHAWILAVRAEVSQAMARRLSEQKRIAEANYQAAKDALLGAEESLASFDREYSLGLMEAKLQSDMLRLIESEQLLEALKQTIPVNEATLEALNEALSRESATLDPAFVMPSPSVAEVPLAQVNPTYAELRRRVAELESLIAASRRRVEALEAELPALKAEIAQATDELVQARLERERLLRQLSEAQDRFEAARQERDAILALERQLPNLARVEVISEPIVPEQPVAPRKMLNVAISVFLAGMASVFGVLVREWWRSSAP